MNILFSISEFFKDLTTEQIIINIGIGLVAGFLAKLLNNSRGGILVCLIIGVIGSFIGPLVLEAFEIEGLGSFHNIIASFVGGALFAWVAGKFFN
jgi:uncharacterized membrane protein YeaQ/YmgE (transglycosylase-associated protein family)